MNVSNGTNLPHTDGTIAELFIEPVGGQVKRYTHTTPAVYDVPPGRYDLVLRRPALAPTTQAETCQAARDVLAERARQIAVEGWTPEHDDAHEGGELADAAVALTLEAGDYRLAALQYWPWALCDIKPATPRRNLVKAAALLLAEIERLDRAASTSVLYESAPCVGHAYPLHGEPGALEQGDAL